jgi:hypothetical protein
MRGIITWIVLLVVLQLWTGIPGAILWYFSGEEDR